MTDSFFEYRDLMDEFYNRIVEFIHDRPAFIKGLERMEAYFSFFQIGETEKRKIVFDRFVFDRKSKIQGKRVLDHFLADEQDLSRNLKTVCEGFRNNAFSLFEVKALRIGKEALIYDLVHDKEYQVRDESVSSHLAKGQCAFLRVLPFKNYFILTGTAFGFPKDVTPILKLTTRNMKEAATKKRQKLSIGPLEMCEIFFSQEKRETLPPIERFRLFCEEAGLDKSTIDEVLDRTRKKAFGQEGHYGDILSELYRKLDPRRLIDPKELSSAYIEVWNGFITQGKPGTEKGPMERTLIGICMDYVRNQIDPKVKGAEVKINELQERWLKIPLEEFDGRTPTEVILEERERLGNPQKEVKFSVVLTELRPGEDLAKQAEATFHEALALMKENKPTEALKVYEEHLRIHPDNFVAWQNKGVCYLLLLDKKEATACFEKALSINPGYEMARRNLKILKRATQADLERMAKEFRVILLNEGKTLEMDEEINA